MMPEIEQRFTQAILEESMRRYEVKKESITSIGGFESFVYEYEKNGCSYILKITSELRRSVDNLLGEAEWINYLADRGVPVCKCVASANNRYVEVIPSEPSNPQFLAISYEKAEGHEATAEDWNEALFEKLGAVMGKMHRVTKSYRVSHSRFRRQEWYQEDQLNAKRYIPSDSDLIRFIEKKVEYLKLVLRGTDAYGLVHSDISPRNFFVNNAGTIHIFDFDDIGYHPFVNDVAIAWYYALNYPPREPSDYDEYMFTFIHHFLDGYRTENSLNASELRLIPEFMLLRHALNYIIFHQTSGPDELNEAGRAMLLEHRNEIIHGTKITRTVEQVLSRLK